MQNRVCVFAHVHAHMCTCESQELGGVPQESSSLFSQTLPLTWNQQTDEAWLTGQCAPGILLLSMQAEPGFFYVDSRDRTRVLMLLQQILYHQLSHLPRSNKSFQKYTGSSPILKRNIFVYNIRRRKKSRLRVGCKLPLQRNLPLLALQLPTSPALALKAGVLSVTFSSVYGRKLGNAFLT